MSTPTVLCCNLSVKLECTGLLSQMLVPDTHGNNLCMRSISGKTKVHKLLTDK